MPFSAKAVANVFISLASSQSKTLTNMQVQKLVYIAHGYFLALRGKHLIWNDIHAWQFGPVIPTLYRALQKYGNGAVTEKVDGVNAGEEPPPDSAEFAIINSVWRNYGDLSGAKLSAITHQDGSPWSEAWNQNRFGKIPDALIQSHYSRLIEQGA